MTRGMMLYYGGLAGIGIGILLTLIFIITAVHKKKKENKLRQMEYDQLLKDMKQFSHDIFSANTKSIAAGETELLDTETIDHRDKTVTLHRQEKHD